MKRLSFLFAALALSACSPNLSPAERYELARVAIDAGHAAEASRHLRAAADAGSLSAIATLATSYSSGSFRQTQAEGFGEDSGARLLTTRQSDWEAHRWARHYFTLLRRPTTDPDLRRMQAQDFLNGQPDGSNAWDVHLGMRRGAPDASPAQRDSATAILRQLVAEGDAEAAHRLAWMSTTDAERERHYATAVELGSAAACFWQSFGAPRATAREYAAYFDAAERCEAMPTWRPSPHYESPRNATLRSLRAQVAKGNAEAEAMLERLTAIGAFADA